MVKQSLIPVRGKNLQNQIREFLPYWDSNCGTLRYCARSSLLDHSDPLIKVSLLLLFLHFSLFDPNTTFLIKNRNNYWFFVFTSIEGTSARVNLENTRTSTKQMRLDRPPAKIWSKSYSNRLLINFCDLIPVVRSIVATISIRIRIQILILNLIYIENWSIMVKIIDKSSRFW